MYVNMEIAKRFGRRAAILISDAKPNADLTSSIMFLHTPLADLRRLRNMGLLSGGEKGDAWRFKGIPSGEPIDLDMYED
jgi:hypothetical protein